MNVLTLAERQRFDAPESAALQTIDVLDVLATPYSPPEFIVEHLFPKVGVVLLSADTGAGKTSFLLHSAFAIATGSAVAGRFNVAAGTVLYVNGEMPPDSLNRFLRANASGLGIDAERLERDRIIFQGDDGFADFYLGTDGATADRFEELLERVRPSIAVLDTFRSLFEADEKETQAVRRVLAWLRTLSNRFGCVFVIAHHQRKLSAVSNAARERVSGARDLIAAVDVHLALKSQSGQPANALLLDKTRSPFQGVTAGAEWPLTASWIDGNPPESRWEAGDPTHATSSPVDTAEQDLRDALLAGPATIRDLDAAGGSRKRALDALRERGEVVQVGKRARAIVLALSSNAKIEETIDDLLF